MRLSQLIICSVFLMLAVLLSLTTEACAEVRIAEVPGAGFAPDAVTDETGTIHVVYVDSTDLYYASSADGGRSFSTPVRINSEAGNVMGGRYRGPDLDMGADGSLHVVWYNRGYQLELPKNDWGVIFARIDAVTGKVSGERNLNNKPSDNYSLAAHSSGAITVIWTAAGMFIQSSSDNGVSFSEPEAVLPETVEPCECCATRALYSPDGTLYVIYRDKRDNMRDMYLLSWPDAAAGGSPEFSRLKLSVETWKIDLCPMTGSYLVPSPDGGLLATWETRSNNRFATLENSGLRFKAQPKLSTEKGNYPVVLINDGGQILTAWKWRNVLYWKVLDPVDGSELETGSFEARTNDRPGGVVLKDGKFLLLP